MLEIAVIGGGLVGASAAYRLLEHGARVTVIDRRDRGQATAAGAGILPPLDHFAGGAPLLPLIRAARAFYPELLQRLREDGESDVGYEISGALHVATDAAELAHLPKLATSWEQARQAGFAHIGDVRVLEGAAARRLFPALGPSVLGAAHAAGAARVDGRRLLAALRSAILKRGGRWWHAEGELVLQGGRLIGAISRGEITGADGVIVAGGAWSAAVAAQLGIDLALRPQRGQLVHLELAGEDTQRWPSVLGFGTHYLLGFPGGRIVAGATREDSAGADYRVTAAGIHAVLDAALRIAPGLSNATLLETRVGFRPVSADGLPTLGPSANAERVYFATGHGGYGLEVGPFSGALVADLAAARPISLDLAPFRAGRQPARS